MSLDVVFYHYNPDIPHKSYNEGEGFYWDDDAYEEDASLNITHNMNKMAMNVPIDKNLTLYNVLWRGDEMTTPIKKGNDFKDYLIKGLTYLAHNKDSLMKFNPDNGYGSYDGLLVFTSDVLINAIRFPDSLVYFSR